MVTRSAGRHDLRSVVAKLRRSIGRTVGVDLPIGKKLRRVRVTVEAGMDAKGFRAYGFVKGAPLSTVRLVLNGGRLNGAVHYGDRVFTYRGRPQAAQILKARTGHNECGADDHDVRALGDKAIERMKKSGAAGTPGPGGRHLDPFFVDDMVREDRVPRIEVMVVASEQTQALHGGWPELRAEVEGAFVALNRAARGARRAARGAIAGKYDPSGEATKNIPNMFHWVAPGATRDHLIDYPWTPGVSTVSKALSDIYQNPEVIARREAIGADIVVFFTDKADVNYCGVAFSRAELRHRAFAYTAMVLPSYQPGQPRGCDIGRIFPHEMGHVMGMLHDRKTEALSYQRPHSDDAPYRPLDYRFGFTYPLQNRSGFRTLMSYPCRRTSGDPNCLISVGMFSDPRIELSWTDDTGAAVSVKAGHNRWEKAPTNNARILRQNAFEVAGYYSGGGAARGSHLGAAPVGLSPGCGPGSDGCSDAVARRPVLRWRAKPGAAAYEVRIDADYFDQHDRPVTVMHFESRAGDCNETDSEGNAVCRFALPKDLPSDRHYWAVRARGGDGGHTAWSDLHRIEVAYGADFQVTEMAFHDSGPRLATVHVCNAGGSQASSNIQFLDFYVVRRNTTPPSGGNFSDYLFGNAASYLSSSGACHSFSFGAGLCLSGEDGTPGTPEFRENCRNALVLEINGSNANEDPNAPNNNTVALADYRHADYAPHGYWPRGTVADRGPLFSWPAGYVHARRDMEDAVVRVRVQKLVDGSFTQVAVSDEMPVNDACSSDHCFARAQYGFAPGVYRWRAESVVEGVVTRSRWVRTEIRTERNANQACEAGVVTDRDECAGQCDRILALADGGYYCSASCGRPGQNNACTHGSESLLCSLGTCVPTCYEGADKDKVCTDRGFSSCGYMECNLY